MSRTIRGLQAFALLEVMIAMGVLGVFIAGMMSMFQLSAKGTRNADQSFDAYSLMNLIQLDLQNSTACSNTVPIGNVIPTDPTAALAYQIPISKVMTAGNSSAVPPISPVPIAAVSPGAPNTFNSVELVNIVTPTGTQPAMSLQQFVSNGTNSYIASFVIIASGTGTSLGAPTFTRTFYVSLQVSAGNVITNCSSAGTFSLGSLGCKFYSGWSPSSTENIPCPANQPYALNGGCGGISGEGGNSGRIGFDYIDTSVLPNTQYCQNNGGTAQEAYITCCP